MALRVLAWESVSQVWRVAPQRRASPGGRVALRGVAGEGISRGGESDSKGKSIPRGGSGFKGIEIRKGLRFDSNEGIEIDGS